MANWTPEGFVGKTFRAMSKLVPPPAGIPASILWGDEKVVKERFSIGVAKLTTERQNVNFKYPFSPEKVVAFFREYFGPTKMAFSRLDPSGQAQLTAELESLWKEHNQSSDGGTSIEVEYLEVRVVKA